MPSFCLREPNPACVISAQTGKTNGEPLYLAAQTGIGSQGLRGKMRAFNDLRSESVRCEFRSPRRKLRLILCLAGSERGGGAGELGAQSAGLSRSKTTRRSNESACVTAAGSELVEQGKACP